MAEATEHAPPDQVPEDWTPQAEVNVEGESMLDDLAALRAERESEKVTDKPLPRFGGMLWARYKLLGTKRTVQVVQATAADTRDLSDGQVTRLCAMFIADATVEVYAKRDRERVHLPGTPEDRPVGWLDLPAQLVPPRPAGKAHDGGTAVRAAINHDNMLCGHALDLAGWMQGAEQEVSDEFAGESEGDPR